MADTMRAVDAALGGTGYTCRTVSWDDVSRTGAGGGGSTLSSFGRNITDTRLYEKSGTLLYTVRSENFNERVGRVKAEQVSLMASREFGLPGRLEPVTLQDALKRLGEYGKYAGLDAGTDLFDPKLDKAVSIRFQTVFLPVPDLDLACVEVAPEMYNYQTKDDARPRNLLLLSTAQGLAVQADGKGQKRIYHHDKDETGQLSRYWFEAERAKNHKVGGQQKESAAEKADALRRGKATAAALGTAAMGSRFNALMTVQVPIIQESEEEKKKREREARERAEREARERKEREEKQRKEREERQRRQKEREEKQRAGGGGGFFGGMFGMLGGGSKKAKEPPVAPPPTNPSGGGGGMPTVQPDISRMKAQIEMLHKKVTWIGRKMDAEFKKAKAAKDMGDKAGAMLWMKRRKALEGQRNTVMGWITSLEAQQVVLEKNPDLQIQGETTLMSADKGNAIMDEAEDTLASCKELTEAANSSMDEGIDLDEDDLMAELNAMSESGAEQELINELADTAMAASVPAVSVMPAAPTSQSLSEDEELALLEAMMGMGDSMPAPSAPAVGRPVVEKHPPKKGAASAARVSKGCKEGTWEGLRLAPSLNPPKRDPSQHVSVTVVLYYTVAGGVPSAEDVKAAVDDMESLYKECEWNGKLSDKKAGFMA